VTGYNPGDRVRNQGPVSQLGTVLVVDPPGLPGYVRIAWDDFGNDSRGWCDEWHADVDPATDPTLEQRVARIERELGIGLSPDVAALHGQEFTPGWTSAYHRVSDDSVSSYRGHDTVVTAMVEALDNLRDPDVDHVWVRDPRRRIIFERKEHDG